MFFTPANPPSVLSFLFLVLVLLFIFRLAVFLSTSRLGLNAVQKSKQVATGTFIWLGVFMLVVYSGLPALYPIPVLPLMVFAILGSASWLAFSPVGGWLARGLSVSALVIFHAFRLPLELILHWWAQQGTIPTTMTWTGQNFDIITGIAAIALYAPAGKSRAVAWGFNLMGFGLLLNVLRVVVMSSPFPFAWQVDPPLQLILYLPYALIAPICVGGAFAAHLILFRKLWTEERATL